MAESRVFNEMGRHRFFKRLAVRSASKGCITVGAVERTPGLSGDALRQPVRATAKSWMLVRGHASAWRWGVVRGAVLGKGP